LGIGTSSPAAKLNTSIAAGAASSTNIHYLLSETGTNSDTGMQIKAINSTNSWDAGAITFRREGSANSYGLVFATSSGGTNNNRMTLDSSGNLGLGVTPSAWYAPGKIIQFGNGNASIGTQYSGDANFMHNAYESFPGTFRYISNGTALRYQLDINNNAHKWYVAPSGTAGDTISFTQAMTLDASGNLGVGTTSPVGALQVLRASANPTVNVTRTTSSATTLGEALYLRLNDSNGQSGMRTEIGMGYGIPGTQTYTPAVIGYVQTIGTANTYGDLYFATRGVTTDTAPTERARITSGGDLLVGTTDNSGTAGNGFKLLNSGTNATIVTDQTTNAGLTTYHLYSTGAAAYRFYVGAGGTVYATNTTISAISDQRFKENIQDLDVGLDKIMALKPRKFDWKAGKGKDIKGDRGFIAQEFEQVFPDLIDEWKDPAPEGEEPYKSVRADLIPVLVKAIQELKSELDSVKAELATLKGK
jgi:hypothetical protein